MHTALENKTWLNVFDVRQGSDTTKHAYGKVTAVDTSGSYTTYVVTMTMTAEDAPECYPREVSWKVATRYSKVEAVLKGLAQM